MPDRLHAKFHVERLDGRDQPGGDKANARYFVLDYANDQYAQAALVAYADACGRKLPGLAADLRAALIPREDTKPAPAQCAKCGNALAACADCGKPAQRGEPWCARHSPDGDWGAALIPREDA